MILDGLFKAIKSLWTKKTTTVVTTSTPLNGAAPSAPTVTAVTTTTETPAQIADADLTTAITIVNNVKNALASPIAVLVTDLIPGNVDDIIREQLVNDLPPLAASLANIKSFVDTADKSAQLNDILAQIRLSPNMDMDAFLHGLAARLLTKISPSGVTWSLAVMAVEYFFKNGFSEIVNAVKSIVSDIKDDFAGTKQVDVPVANAPALPGPTTSTDTETTVTN